MKTYICIALSMLFSASFINAQNSTKPDTGIIIKESAGVDSKQRHGDYSKAFAKPNHFTTEASTYFGGKDMEEFLAAGGLKDGRIVAIGNAWGPSFPRTPRATVLGRGKHHGKQVPMSKRGEPSRGVNYQSGFFVIYSSNLRKAEKAIRFDWGVASVGAAIVANNGKEIIIAGQCGDYFGSLKGKLGKLKKLPYVAPKVVDDGKKKKRKSKAPANPRDVFIASISPEGKFNWTVVLEKTNTSPAAIFTDMKGRLWFNSGGLYRVDADGKNAIKFADRKNGRTAKWLGVHPDGSAAYYGGDRNTHTGAEPWRQPYMYKYEKGTNKVYTFWETSPRAVGAKGDGSHLMSDSSPRTLNFMPDNNTMIITGWSDGGNSVFKRQPDNHHKKVEGKVGPGFAAWGVKGANSFTHFMRIDEAKKETLAHGNWNSYTPSWFGGGNKYANRPNAAHIVHTRTTKSGYFAFTGKAATGLIQTPGAYWQDSKDGSKYGGNYITILNDKMWKGMFSSYLPGSSNARVDTFGDVVLVTSKTKGNDGKEKPTESIAINAAQPKFGGKFDAHLIMLVPPEP